MRLAGVMALLAIAAAFPAVAFPEAAQANETVFACNNGPNYVFGHSAVFGINTSSSCPGNPAYGGGLRIATAGNTVAVGQRADWQATAPSGLAIVGASIGGGGMASSGINDGEQYGGGFYWASGGASLYDGETSAGFGPFFSSYFGVQVICGNSPSCSHGNSYIGLSDIALYVQETSGPTLSSPDGLWQSTGWVRGDWTLHIYGDSPSGLCDIGGTINRLTVANSGSGQDQSVWHQCDAPVVDTTIHTWQYGDGSMPLMLSAWDAAGKEVSYTKNINIDNSQPTVTMSGPTDAPSTAGVRYVTATAGGGPSGIDGLACSVDGAPDQWYPGASAHVPVGGVGGHSVQCSAANNAVDSAGNHGWSSPASWSLKIGDPTVSGISFRSIVDSLRCGEVNERVKLPARWVTVRRGHKRVKVRKPAHTRVVKVTRCHPRTELRRVTVWVTVRRHGKKVRIRRTEVQRVVLPPHLVSSTKRFVPYGHATTINGWLGTYNGVALGRQKVTVLTAADNGQGQFAPAATATTAANGSWVATLPPGPSRLVEALYSGGATTEASVSGQALVIVPAKVDLLSVSPRRVAWGGTIHIVGQLEGGYLPPGGALVRLRIGEGSANATYGVKEHVKGDGRFSTTYTFGAGEPSFHKTYWFQVASLPMGGDYPFSPADSRKITVAVGGHPRGDRVAAQASFESAP